MIVSYILPCYHKASLLRLMLPVNECYRANDVEVILVLDEPTEARQVLQIVRETRDIKFQVIVNDWDHVWRPPCIAYNIGIRYARAQHVILTDPESAISMPVTDYPDRLIREDFRACYSGLCWYDEDMKLEDSPEVIRHKMQVCEATGKVWHWGNGFLLAPKLALERIYGFDESRTSYGLDDNDIRVRLARLGNRCVIDGAIKVFHAGHSDTHRTLPTELPGPNIALREQKESWGRQYSRVLFDYQNV